jgi:hypothetical protein
MIHTSCIPRSPLRLEARKKALDEKIRQLLEESIEVNDNSETSQELSVGSAERKRLTSEEQRVR